MGAEELGWTREARGELYPLVTVELLATLKDGRMKKWTNRIQWVRQCLVQPGLIGTWIVAGAAVLSLTSACRSENTDVEPALQDLFYAARTMVNWNTLFDDLSIVDDQYLAALVDEVNSTCERVDSASERLMAYRDDIDENLFFILTGATSDLHLSCEGYTKINELLQKNDRLNHGLRIRGAFSFPDSKTWVDQVYRLNWQAHQGCALAWAATIQYGGRGLVVPLYSPCWPTIGYWDSFGIYH